MKLIILLISLFLDLKIFCLKLQISSKIDVDKLQISSKMIKYERVEASNRR